MFTPHLICNSTSILSALSRQLLWQIATACMYAVWQLLPLESLLKVQSLMAYLLLPTAAGLEPAYAISSGFRQVPHCAGSDSSATLQLQETETQCAVMPRTMGADTDYFRQWRPVMHLDLDWQCLHHHHARYPTPRIKHLLRRFLRRFRILIATWPPAST